MNAARQMKCLFKKLVVMPAIAIVLFSCEKKTVRAMILELILKIRSQPMTHSTP
jgi:hypothetical protein